MKFNIDKKSIFSILAVVAVGIVLALAIIFWKKDAPAAEGASEHAEETTEKSGTKEGRPAGGKEAGHGEGKEGGHADDKPGFVRMMPQQIQGAGIVTARAAAATVDTAVILPGPLQRRPDGTRRSSCRRCRRVCLRLAWRERQEGPTVGCHRKRGTCRTAKHCSRR